jgi:parallel beta-helix repeat protein
LRAGFTFKRSCAGRCPAIFAKAAFGLVLVCGTAVFSAEFYVSPLGDDQGKGSLTQPFRTLQRTVDAAREWRNSGGSGPVTIFLREGRHQLDSTLVLGIRDGASAAGKPGSLDEPGSGPALPPPRLTFKGYTGETPVISAGAPVNGWQLADPAPSALPSAAKGKVWVADIPQGLNRFYTLFDSLGRLDRAQGDGFKPTGVGDRKTLHFPAGALKNWSNLSDVEIFSRPKTPYNVNMLPLESVNEGSRIARTAVSATYEISPLKKGVSNPQDVSMWVENVLEALDKPGEWVVNTQTGKVYLWPRDPAADGSPRGILAPSASELVRIEGEIDYNGPSDNPVRGIAIMGITFSHGDRRAWTTDAYRLGWGLQHDWEMFDRPTAMLRFRGAEECLVFQCRFEHSGGTGLRMDLHAQRNRIVDCEFANLGEAGILLAGYGLGTKDVNRNNDILNNHVHDFGEIIWHAAGIWAWQSGYNRIANNHVHHCPYSGILLTTRIWTNSDLDDQGGRTVRRNEISAEAMNMQRTYDNWLVREKYMHSRHNLVEYNEISHSVQTLTDGNGIYISGAGTGNIIRYNYLHDNDDPTVGETIRCDDDQHRTLIYGNILERSDGKSVIQIKGINDIINNFIVQPSDVPSRRGYIEYAGYRVTGSKVRRNIIVSHPEGGNPQKIKKYKWGVRDGLPKLEEIDMDSNLYFNPGSPSWAGEHLENMRQLGLEEASISTDPLFVDYEGGDYRFQANSPALAMGIEPLDISLMGRREGLYTRAVPRPRCPGPKIGSHCLPSKN